jgi:hypothetical protein
MVHIEWPSGALEQFSNLARHQFYTLVEPSLRDSLNDPVNLTVLTTITGQGETPVVPTDPAAPSPSHRFYRMRRARERTTENESSAAPSFTTHLLPPSRRPGPAEDNGKRCGAKHRFRDRIPGTWACLRTVWRSPRIDARCFVTRLEEQASPVVSAELGSTCSRSAADNHGVESSNAAGVNA